MSGLGTVGQRPVICVDGRVVAMSPGSATHGLIQMNLGALIRHRLTETGSRCLVLSEAAIVPRVGANSNVRVPDLLVTCSAIAAGQIVVPDPVLLVEILSPSNASTTWANVWAYSTIPSARRILVVHSTRMKAHLLTRLPDGVWPEMPADVEEHATLRLDTVGLACPLPELYAGTHLVVTGRDGPAARSDGCAGAARSQSNRSATPRLL